MTHTPGEVRKAADFLNEPTNADPHFSYAEVENMLRAYADLLAKPKLTREGLAKALFENQSNGVSWYNITDIARGYWYGDADALIAAGVEVAGED